MYEGEVTNMEFPCDFPIKIMGRANLDFELKILSIIRKHTPDLGETAIRVRHSKEGNYMSITVTIPAKSKQQLDAIYQELSSEKTVLMLL